VIRQYDEREERIEFDAIRLKLASPEAITAWSSGEVAKPETINYRTQKPEKDGLFCERIFGPVRDYECHCGKYKRVKYKGVVCERCGVEVTLSKVRRERMGHIELAVPVAHIWFYKTSPSKIGLLLDLSITKLERVLYYESFIVIDPGTAPVHKKDLLSEEEVNELKQNYVLEAKTSAEAIRDLLAEIDMKDLSAELRQRIKIETSAEMRKKLLSRLRVVEAFRTSDNKPEWMILEVIPVIPPDLRPLVALEGGRFATSDLNDLYRRVITRNNRLKHLIGIKAPEIILRNEKRMLQEAVDALLDNSRMARVLRGRGNRPLKSLSDSLKGKQGRFRQNLLGKRVDYSGRSVVVVGPKLKLHQCGLPKRMALELFKPFIIRQLEEKGYATSMKAAKKLLEHETPEVWEILEEIIQGHPVLLNRAPTLHRLSIQAFEPVLVEGKAIELHPLVCSAFNADFDGDQMAVHLPISFEAQAEAYLLMLATNNVLSPAYGKPLAVPTQDMVIGCHFLTKKSTKENRKPKGFASEEEVLHAVENGVTKLHDEITILLDGEIHHTTPGRVIFNSVVPKGLGFINAEMNRTELVDLTYKVYRKHGNRETTTFLDKLKDLGFEYATKSGLTFGIDDMIVPKEKGELIAKAFREVAKIHREYEAGALTDGERYNKVIDTWTDTTSTVAEELMLKLAKDKHGFNSIYMMAASGARGSKDQIRQLAGLRGLMARPQRRITGQIGEIIESPIISNFKEGLTVLEYFISTHGGRKGLADTALKTADAGYLTRRLIDVAQDVVITETDCGTILGQEMMALKEGEKVIEMLSERVVGKTALEDVISPMTGEVIVKSGEEITEEKAQEIEESGTEKVRIRSVLTCEAKRGLCAKCYGRNLATGNAVQIGEAVGIVAAQSIGEPGTQLTLRTFHIGGIATRITEESKAITKISGKVHFENLRLCVRPDEAKIAISRNGIMKFVTDKGPIRYTVPYGANVKVENKEQVEAGHILYEWDPYTHPVISEHQGKARYVDIVEDITIREELDERTGTRQRVIVEHKEKTLHPAVLIHDDSKKPQGHYPIPTGAYVLVRENDEVFPGSLLAKIPLEIGKTKDITGGLPRVAELFEARKPKDHAVVTEIDGTVKSGKVSKGTKPVTIVSPTGEERVYQIPYGKHLRVVDGEFVRAGDKLSEGPLNPHDILKIKGLTGVQEYLVNDIQEVYRLQNVKIDDKHIGVIVRQMLQKVKIEDPGDTVFIEGETLDRVTLKEENERVIQEGGKPATFQPLLLGITKAALSTQSFISAASFQETTRVLAEAAIAGKKDSLLGLKENVIMGSLIPAGTGLKKYRRIELEVAEEEEIEEESEEVESSSISRRTYANDKSAG